MPFRFPSEHIPRVHLNYLASGLGLEFAPGLTICTSVQSVWEIMIITIKLYIFLSLIMIMMIINIYIPLSGLK